MAVYYKGTHARAPGQARKSWGYRTTEVHGLQLVVCMNVIRCSPEPAAFSCWMPINWGLGSLTFSGSTFLYDFQTLVSSEDLSLSNILYLKLIKVELLWIKVGVRVCVISSYLFSHPVHLVQSLAQVDAQNKYYAELSFHRQI